MIAMQLKPVPQKKMPPTDKGMHYGHKFQIMSGLVKLMVLEFSRLICNHSTILHQHRTHAFQRSISTNHELTYMVRHCKDWRTVQTLLKSIKQCLTML